MLYLYANAGERFEIPQYDEFHVWGFQGRISITVKNPKIEKGAKVPLSLCWRGGDSDDDGNEYITLNCDTVRVA